LYSPQTAAVAPLRRRSSSFSVAASAPLPRDHRRISHSPVLARVLQPLDRSPYLDSPGWFRFCARRVGGTRGIGIDIFFEIELCTRERSARLRFIRARRFVILSFSIILQVSVNKCAYCRVCRFRGFHVSMQPSLLQIKRTRAREFGGESRTNSMYTTYKRKHIDLRISRLTLH